MSNLNDLGFHYIDGVDDVMAEYINELLASLLKGRMTNAQTITATLVLDDASLPIQTCIANGSSQDVCLAVEASTNHLQVIYNAGTVYNLIVKNSSGTTTYAIVPPGKFVLCVPTGSAWIISSNDVNTLNNVLINGGFDFAGRLATPGTLTTIADNKYGPDRWRITRANADAQYQRNDALGENGLKSQYYGSFKKITNSGKLHVCQIVEGINSVPLRGRTVTFSVKMKVSSAKTVRMAVLELQNAGTIDTIPATLVTSWNADGADPTLGANVAVISAAQSKSVTTAWQSFDVSVIVPSNSKNLICAIWSDAAFAANDILHLAEAGLHVGGAAPSWTAQPVADEVQRCERYYMEKQSNLWAMAVTTAVVQGALFRTKMRTTPTVTIISDTGTVAKVSNTAGADVGTTVTANVVSAFGFRQCNDSGAGFTAGAWYGYTFTAEAEL